MRFVGRTLGLLGPKASKSKCRIGTFNIADTLKLGIVVQIIVFNIVEVWGNSGSEAIQPHDFCPSNFSLSNGPKEKLIKRRTEPSKYHIIDVTIYRLDGTESLVRVISTYRRDVARP